MLLDGAVQERGARHVRVGDPVVGEDPDRHPAAGGWRRVRAAAGRAACSRDASASASWIRPRSAAGNRAISMSSRSRSPASPCTEVIACSGIPASSRRSAGSSLIARTGHQLRGLICHDRLRLPSWLRLVCGLRRPVRKLRPPGHDHAGDAANTAQCQRPSRQDPPCQPGRIPDAAKGWFKMRPTGRPDPQNSPATAPAPAAPALGPHLRSHHDRHVTPRLSEPPEASGEPHKNPTSPPPGPPPQTSHGHDGIPRHTPALMLK